MPRKAKTKVAAETRELRLKLHELTQAGQPANEALIEVLPKDGNRRRKLRSWETAGLWPVPESELSEAPERSAVTETSERPEVPDMSEATDVSKLSDMSEASGASERSELSETSEMPESSEAAETSEPSVMSELPEPSDTPIPDAWRREVRDLVREEITSMMQSQTLPKVPTTGVEWPPIPPEEINPTTKRTRARGSREKLGVIIDAELHRLFHEWTEEHDLSYSKGLETVLWLFFDRPKLSFEVSEASEMPEASEVSEGTGD